MKTALGDKQVPRRKSKMNRDRLELRADSEWIARVTAVAERFGLSVSAYIRFAVTQHVEEQERNPAPQPPKKGAQK
jgi:hypothetical protein